MKLRLRHLIQIAATKLDLKLGPGVTTADQLRQRHSAVAIMRRMYGACPVPGVILGDEVGMGKTYVALTIAAALLHERPAGRILVLAHSRAMARVWRDRWESLRQATLNLRLKLPEGIIAKGQHELGAGITFAAYDTLKHVSTRELKATLRSVLRSKAAPRGRLRRRLILELFPRCRRLTDASSRPVPVSRSEIKAFWRKFIDWDEGTWQSVNAVHRELKRLYFAGAVRRRHRIGLLVIDEAHKLAGVQRGSFFDCVFGDRAERALLVTATPFSLEIGEFRERIRDLFSLCGSDDASITGDHGQLWVRMKGYRDAVRRRDPRYSKAMCAELEQDLGRFFVRSNQKRNRQAFNLSGWVSQTPTEMLQRLGTMALEGEFSKIYRDGCKTQIANRRQTLCSSFAAARESERLRGNKESRLAALLSKALHAGLEHPKLEGCVAWADDQLPPRQKLVIFCNRLATIRALKARLSALYAHDARVTARKWDGFRRRLLKEYYEPLKIAKLRMAFAHDMKRTRDDIAGSIRRCDAEADGLGKPLWVEAWGARHRIPWVETLTGERDDGDQGRSNEAVRFAFNLPGPPYVLIASAIGREGIDLHRHCRRVMHYDLEWSPTAMEQRVGRVDRIGSLARREKKKVEIYYLMTPGSYEERIYGVVKERMDLVRALLGAGEWLKSHNLSRQFVSSPAGGEVVDDKIDIAPYRLDFTP